MLNTKCLSSPTGALSLTLLALMQACQQPNSRDVEHPIRDMLLSAEVERVTVTKRVSPDVDQLLPLAAQLSEMAPVVRIGSEEGEPGEMIGLIQDAQFDGDSAILILDSRFNTVNMYDRVGQHTGSIGGPGRGPGELFIPLGIELGGPSMLLVSDESMSIHRFDRYGSEWRFVESQRTGVLPIDMCVSGNTLYIHGHSDTRREAVYLFDLQGNELGSFGVPYRSDNPLIRQVLSEGRILCSPQGDVVYMAFVRVPEIHAYTAAGELIWITEIEQYDQMPIVEREGGSMRLGISLLDDNDKMHMLRSFAFAPSGALIVQLGLYVKAEFEKTKSYSSVDTYVIDARSGKGRYVGNSVPVVADVAQSSLLGIADDPFPHATIYEAAPRPPSHAPSRP